MRFELVICSLGLGLWFTGCVDGGPDGIDDLFSDAEWEKISRFTPLGPPPPSPTNRYADDEAAAAFGQRLWFERRYAGAITVEGTPENGGLGAVGETGKISCADCHDPQQWFIDTRSIPNALSLGSSRTKRNSPSMVNAVYYDWVGWAGAHDQFWKQGASVPENKESFNGDRLRFAHVVYEHYRADYDALFPPHSPPIDPALDPLASDAGRFPPNGKPKASGATEGPWEMMAEGDRTIVNTIMANCGKALEAYERLLVSRDAPFDRYVARDFGALSESAKRGLKLFIGKAACDSCHQDQTFTDNAFHNTGVVQAVAPYDDGHFADVLRLADPFNGAGIYSDDRDAGAAKLAGLAQTESMMGQFRTKSLRHVAQTAPYFHDGSVPTLEAVVRFYNSGGGTTGYPGAKDPRMVPLNLSEQEILDLVAFLESLTGAPVPERLQMNTAAP